MWRGDVRVRSSSLSIGASISLTTSVGSRRRPITAGPRASAMLFFRFEMFLLVRDDGDGCHKTMQQSHAAVRGTAVPLSQIGTSKKRRRKSIRNSITRCRPPRVCENQFKLLSCVCCPFQAHVAVAVAQLPISLLSTSNARIPPSTDCCCCY